MKKTLNFETAEIVRPLGRAIPEDLAPRLRSYYINRGDLCLRVMFATSAKSEPRGSIIFSPGRTEFSEKYLETLADLTARGFNILILDPRGQGLSDRLTDDPLKSYVRDFQDYADDLAFAAEQFAPLLPKPHLLFGHSMGGTIVLQAVISGAMSPSAVICSAPMLGLFDLESSVTSWLIRLMSHLGFKKKNLPFQTQKQGIPIPFENNKLTSDPKRYAIWASYFLNIPKLRVGQPTYGWITAALRSMAFVNRNASKLKIPGLIIAAGADPIVDPASNKAFARAAGIEFDVVAGARHELFMEQDIYRDRFFARIDKFLDDSGL